VITTNYSCRISERIASQGCSQNDQADPNYAAATGPDNRAKADKIAFVGEWNPIAAKYGLTSYQWDQL
jgi:hypothetical protein